MSTHILVSNEILSKYFLNEGMFSFPGSEHYIEKGKKNFEGDKMKMRINSV